MPTLSVAAKAVSGYIARLAPKGMKDHDAMRCRGLENSPAGIARVLLLNVLAAGMVA
jgi:hypothetical protein